MHKEEIYRWSDENKATPKTSAVSPAEALEVLTKALEVGEYVICFCISDQMSSTGNVLRVAAKELEAEERIFVVDSKNLSTGIGLQIIEAALMAIQDREAEEIVEYITELQPRVRASFVVDTLTYLHRGGRCSGLAAFAGGAIKLHPLISVTDGTMHPGKKYRGRMDSVLLDYVRDMEDLVTRAGSVITSHCGPGTLGVLYIAGE